MSPAAFFHAELRRSLTTHVGSVPRWPRHTGPRADTVPLTEVLRWGAGEGRLLWSNLWCWLFICCHTQSCGCVRQFLSWVTEHTACDFLISSHLIPTKASEPWKRNRLKNILQSEAHLTRIMFIADDNLLKNSRRCCQSYRKSHQTGQILH